MLKLDEIQKRLLREVADLHGVPEGAYNIRSNSASAGRQSTANIEIVPKEEVSGLEIRIKPGTKNESVHIPVVMTQSGLKEVVYNDFFIGEGADVVIIAGCGIDNCGNQDSQHAEMEMVQIKGVDDTERTTTAELAAGAKLVVRERLMTHGDQRAISNYVVNLNGEGSSADVVSRSVARDHSFQKFDAKIAGNAACHGHTECDSIIMDEGRILAVPALEANNVDAELVHEAAIGKIAGEQLIKLMSLGLTAAEAEEQIINGFLQ